MADVKTILASSLASGGIIILAMLSPGFFDEPKYICESRPDIGMFECDAFSQYVDPNGRCINATQEGITYSSKICRTGWSLVKNDVFVEEPEIDNLPAYPEWEKPPKRIECSVDECINYY